MKQDDKVKYLYAVYAVGIPILVLLLLAGPEYRIMYEIVYYVIGGATIPIAYKYGKKEGVYSGLFAPLYWLLTASMIVFWPIYLLWWVAEIAVIRPIMRFFIWCEAHRKRRRFDGIERTASGCRRPKFRYTSDIEEKRRKEKANGKETD